MTVDLIAELDKQRQRVDVDHADFSIKEIVRMVSDNELVMAPEYQRQFRWDERRESELIESVFLGLPIPPVFVATNADGTWDLVDGLQRISSIIHFAADPGSYPSHIQKTDRLRLSAELSRLEGFSGLTYDDLPKRVQLLFDRRLLRVTALSDKSQMDVRFDLFERLNRGGITLSPQEVRACIYRGPLNNLIEDLAKGLQASKLLKLQKGSLQDGTYAEQVLKFFAYLEARANFKHLVGEFLNEFMDRNKSDVDVAAWRATAELAFRDLQQVFQSGPLLKKGSPTTPLNQFEALIVAAAELRREGKTPAGHPTRIMNDAELIAASTRGTNSPRALEARIARARVLLSQV